MILEDEKCKMKVMTDFVPGKSSLSGLQRDVFLLYPHMAEREREREREREIFFSLLSLLIRALIPL